jgi:hypothetical protein
MLKNLFITISTALTAIIIILLFPPSPFRSEEAFLWPIKLPKGISGTLGEKRGHFFHNGIDIKTNGRNGYPVHATSSGLLHRIISRENGYGNAMQIKHSNNHYSFYAHLQKFEDIRFGINSLIPLLKILYNRDSIDFRFYETKCLFNRGDTIGFTGESGSGYPHLHLELREKSGTTNPLRYIPITDNIKPVINNIFLCIEKAQSTVYEKRIRVYDKRGRYRPEINPISTDIRGKVFFKVSCYDRVGALNRVGIHKIQLFEEDKEIYGIQFERLRWRDYPYGAMIYDISKSLIDGKLTYTYFLCRREGNNFSGLSTTSNGYILLSKGEKKFKILVHDYAGNSAEVAFSIVPAVSDSKDPKDLIPLKRGSRYTIANKSREIRLHYKSNTLLNDTLIRVSEVNPEGIARYLHEKFSIIRDDILKVYSIVPHDIVYRYPLNISISRPLRITPTEAQGILIYHFFDGEYPQPLATKYSIRHDTFMTGTKTNGFFALIRDRKAPSIVIPPTHEFVQDIKIYRRMRFYTRDNLSGIQLNSISCYIDGELYPFRFDNDRKWIEFQLPRNAIARGLHHILIRCVDYSGNYGEFRGLFGF